MKEEEGKENAIKTHGGRDTPGPINEGPSDNESVYYVLCERHCFILPQSFTTLRNLDTLKLLSQAINMFLKALSKSFHLKGPMTDGQ